MAHRWSSGTDSESLSCIMDPGESSSELVSSAMVCLKAANMLLPLSVITVRIFSFGMAHSCIHLSTLNRQCSVWVSYLFKGQQYVYMFISFNTKVACAYGKEWGCQSFFCPHVKAHGYSSGSSQSLFEFLSFSPYWVSIKLLILVFFGTISLLSTISIISTKSSSSIVVSG